MHLSCSNNKKQISPWMTLGILVLTFHFSIQMKLSSCNGKNPVNPSKDVCKELCTNSNSSSCTASGSCLCEKEPTPTTIGGSFVHCTNWNYVDQTECKTACEPTGKNDTRVCWTVLYGNYCTCFNS